MPPEQIARALDAAFTAHVALLFANLCLNAKDPDALDRFMKGFDTALTSHAAAMKQYAPQG